jgi:hypothetical protein
VSQDQPDSGDVPFEDQPTRRDAPGDRPRPVPEDGPATEERTTPHPGSTRPTTMREDFGTLADEGRRLWEAVETRIVAPALRSYPDVVRHLGAAGREVMEAYRSAVRNQEQIWREQHPDSQRENITVERVEERDDDRH